MVDQAMITKAIGAHGMWKERLKKAIATGQSEFQVAGVQVDNGCEFGKWLYSLPGSDRMSPGGKAVVDLHAKFHKEAARVLGMALAGQKAEADKAIGFGSDFAKISGDLTKAMMMWQKA